MTISKSLLLLTSLLLCTSTLWAQRKKTDRVRSTYNFVGPVKDGLILVHRGGERAHPKLGLYGTDGVFGYIDIAGTVVVKPVYDYARDFNNGFAVVGKGVGIDRKFEQSTEAGVR